MRRLLRSALHRFLRRERYVKPQISGFPEFSKSLISAAEKIAKDVGNADAVLAELRKLPLDDFGLLLIALPSADLPHLSRVLPGMAAEEVQVDWTGSHGIDLFAQTSAFARLLENNLARHRNRGLRDATIMDFGCGYGRILRMMYYHTAPQNIWGVDAWQRSLAYCTDAGMPGNFVQSERVPTSLPVGETKFDLAYAMSVFTHLSEDSARACLAAVRKHMAADGLFIATIRPIEIWQHLERSRDTKVRTDLENQHRDRGYAYLPHNGIEGETYGDSSIDASFFETDGWTVLGIDRSIADPFQVAVVLAPS